MNGGERELIAMMAAVLRAGDIANGEVTSSLHGCVDEAEVILGEIDARAAARREPPATHAYVAGPILGVCDKCGCDIDADTHAVI